MLFRSFFHANLFAGVLVANSAPFTGSSQSASLAAASWKFNVVHLAHLQDTTFGIDWVRSTTDAIQAAGHPMTRIEMDGEHWNDAGDWVNGHQMAGTDPDIYSYLFPYLNKGWSAP